MEHFRYNSAQFFISFLLHHKFLYTHMFLNVCFGYQEAGVMSPHFTFESAETQYMYVLGSNFSDKAYYLCDFMLHF
jgi:hypothetical protein